MLKMEGFPSAKVGTDVLGVVLEFFSPKDLCTTVARVHPTWCDFLRTAPAFRQAQVLRLYSVRFHQLTHSGVNYLLDPNSYNLEFKDPSVSYPGELRLTLYNIDLLLGQLYQITMFYGCSVELWSEIVSRLHRYLEARRGSPCRLQLVGCAALLASYSLLREVQTASETSNWPSAGELCRTFDNEFAPEEVLECVEAVRRAGPGKYGSSEPYLATSLLLKSLCPEEDHALLWYVYELFTFEYEYHTLQAKDSAAAIVEFVYTCLLTTRLANLLEFLHPYPTPAARRAVGVMYRDAHPNPILRATPRASVS